MGSSTELHAQRDNNPNRIAALDDVVGAGLEFSKDHVAMYAARLAKGLPVSVKRNGAPYRPATAAEKTAAGGTGAPDYSMYPGAGPTGAVGEANTFDWMPVGVYLEGGDLKHNREDGAYRVSDNARYWSLDSEAIRPTVPGEAAVTASGKRKLLVSHFCGMRLSFDSNNDAETEAHTAGMTAAEKLAEHGNFRYQIDIADFRIYDSITDSWIIKPLTGIPGNPDIDPDGPNADRAWSSAVVDRTTRYTKYVAADDPHPRNEICEIFEDEHVITIDTGSEVDGTDGSIDYVDYALRAPENNLKSIRLRVIGNSAVRMWGRYNGVLYDRNTPETTRYIMPNTTSVLYSDVDSAQPHWVSESEKPADVVSAISLPAESDIVLDADTIYHHIQAETTGAAFTHGVVIATNSLVAVGAGDLDVVRKGIDHPNKPNVVVRLYRYGGRAVWFDTGSALIEGVTGAGGFVLSDNQISATLISTETGWRIFDFASTGVIQGAAAALPSAGTVAALTTNDTTPTITGTMTLAAGETFSVDVGGVTYSLGDGDLADTGAGTWALTIPAANALNEGTFSITATTTNVDGVDAVATGSLTIDTTSPATPTVGTASFTNGTPTIDFGAVLAAGETLAAEIDGVTYVVGDGNLVNNGNDTFSLTIPAGNALADGDYDLQITVTDAAGNTSTDSSTDEITIAPAPTTFPPLLKNTGQFQWDNYAIGSPIAANTAVVFTATRLTNSQILVGFLTPAGRTAIINDPVYGASMSAADQAINRDAGIYSAIVPVTLDSVRAYGERDAGTIGNLSASVNSSVPGDAGTIEVSRDVSGNFQLLVDGVVSNNNTGAGGKPRVYTGIVYPYIVIRDSGGSLGDIMIDGAAGTWVDQLL